jgi:hypothetical protein
MSSVHNGSTNTRNLSRATGFTSPSYPCALFFWVKSTDDNQYQCAACWSNNNTDGSHDAIEGIIGWPAANNPAQATVASNGVYGAGSSATGLTAGVWIPCSFLFTSTTSRQAKVGTGAWGTPETVSRPPNSLNTSYIGIRRTSSAQIPLNARIAHVTWWAGLSAASDYTAIVDALHRGTLHPLKALPSKIIEYSSLIHAANISGNIGGRWANIGSAWTENNSPVYDVADNPAGYAYSHLNNIYSRAVSGPTEQVTEIFSFLRRRQRWKRIRL